jgi:quinol monooxygenase YgiN
MHKDAGQLSSRVFHMADDPNNLLIFQEWNSVDNAAKFVQSMELKEAMQQAGVLEQPDVYFLNEA